MTDQISHLNPHLKELRKRVVASLLFVLMASVACYGLRVPLADLFMAPLFTAYPELDTLIYTNLTEALFSYLKLALLAGIMVSFPFLLYQAWMYIAPGLHRHEKRTVFLVVFFATVLFFSGAAFSFFIVLPKALTFLMSFAGPGLTPQPKFGAYLAFVARALLAFGLAFQIPFLMVAAAKIGWVARSRFTQKRLWFYLAILILSFLLTAGDLLSTVLLALPLVGLYEAGILVMYIFVRSPKKEE